MTTYGKVADTIDHTLTGTELKAAGYVAVCRYYAGGASHIGKEITAAEVPEKTAAGIRIVSNWEVGTSPADTVAQGEADARAFVEQHASVGGPDWAPCYFSVDRSIAPTSMHNYFTGVCNILGVARVGCYGEDALIVALHNAGLITYGWRSMSSSFPGNPATADCHLKQTGSGHIYGHAVDFNDALQPLYGGWLQGEDDPMAELAPADVTMAVWGQTADKGDAEWDVIPNTSKNVADSPAHTPPGTNANTGAGYALGRTRQLAEDNAVDIAVLKTELAALQAAVAKIPTTAVPAGPMSDADVQRIATATAAQLGKVISNG